MKKLTFTLGLTLIFILLAHVTSHAKKSMNVTFKEKITMDRDSLQLKDIVDPELTDLSFIKKYGALPIASDKDSTQTINRSNLYSLLHKNGAHLEDLKFTMNKSVSVERGREIKFEQSIQNKFRTILADTYNIPKNDIEISKARILPVVTEEELPSLYIRKVVSQDLRDLDNAKFNILIEDIDGRSQEYTVYLKLNIETPVLMATQDIDEEFKLSNEQFITGRQKITKLDGPIMSTREFNTKTFKSSSKIRKDQILTQNLVRHSVIIDDGKLVTLRYKTPFLNISTLGKIHGNAEIGKLVRVENIESKRIINGKLISPELVEVVNE